MHLDRKIFDMRAIRDADAVRSYRQSQIHRRPLLLHLAVDHHHQSGRLRNQTQRSRCPLQIDDESCILRNLDDPILIAEPGVAHHESMAPLGQRYGARRGAVLVAVEHRFGIGRRRGELKASLECGWGGSHRCRCGLYGRRRGRRDRSGCRCFHWRRGSGCSCWRLVRRRRSGVGVGVACCATT
jgi:hypothetical protein